MSEPAVNDRTKLLAEFIQPLRVKPGSKVRLARDFDPGYKAGFLKKKDGAVVLQAGVEEQQAARESKQARKQRKQMKKLREKLAEAKW